MLDIPLFVRLFGIISKYLPKKKANVTGDEMRIIRIYYDIFKDFN